MVGNQRRPQRTTEIACQQELKDELRQIIEDALANYEEPQQTSGEGWWSPLWQVIRACRAHPLLRDRNGYGAWQIVSRLVNVESLIAADCRLGDVEDTAAAWVDAHDRIRYMPGETMLDLALQQAEAHPVSPPGDCTDGYRRFLSLVAAVARMQENNVIAIPVERWAEVLNVRPNTISCWRRSAQSDGILRQERPHSHASRRATEYGVALERLLPPRGTL